MWALVHLSKVRPVSCIMDKTPGPPLSNTLRDFSLMKEFRWLIGVFYFDAEHVWAPKCAFSPSKQCKVRGPREKLEQKASDARSTLPHVTFIPALRASYSRYYKWVLLPFAFWCCFPRKQMSVSSPGHECSGNSRTLCAIKMLRALRGRSVLGVLVLRLVLSYYYWDLESAQLSCSSIKNGLIGKWA